MDLLAESEDCLTEDSALSIGISRAGARSQTLASWHGGNRWRPVCSRLFPKTERNKSKVSSLVYANESVRNDIMA